MKSVSGLFLIILTGLHLGGRGPHKRVLAGGILVSAYVKKLGSIFIVLNNTLSKVILLEYINLNLPLWLRFLSERIPSSGAPPRGAFLQGFPGIPVSPRRPPAPHHHQCHLPLIL